MHFALITLLAVAGALAQPSVPNLPKINPDAPLAYVDWSAVVASPSTPLTNAKRFEQGLSPLKPKMKRHRGGPHGGTRVRSAPRAQISPAPPVSVSCKLFATLADGTPKGYVVPEWNDFGEYYKFQPTQEGALSVSFSYSPDAPSEIALTATNGPHKESFPFFGGVLGYATSTVDYAFGPGSYNYAYLAGTTQTEPGAPPTDGLNSFTTASGYDRKIESSIWTYNPATTELSAQWVNADLTTPTTYITYTQGVMTLNGDPNAAANTFGSSEILKLKCVPPVTVVPV